MLPLQHEYEQNHFDFQYRSRFKVIELFIYLRVLGNPIGDSRNIYSSATTFLYLLSWL